MWTGWIRSINKEEDETTFTNECGDLCMPINMRSEISQWKQRIVWQLADKDENGADLRHLDSLEGWAVKNSMKFNKEKCKFLHLGQNSRRAQHRLRSVWMRSSLAERGARDPDGLEVEHESTENHCSIRHRITEYAELEGNHKDHGVQLLALHRTIPKSHTACLRVLPSEGKPDLRLHSQRDC
ncbi:hypothetical protein BTVI_71017 [Pitangus sulphuratus]|nr:hypothetical protein BTVI_71017 [Pitangus sulphuratus]